MSPEKGKRVREHMKNPSTFLLVAKATGGTLGMAGGTQGLADDGVGPPVRGSATSGPVFVAPDHRGRGLGGELVDAVLSEARTRGYGRAQGRTQADNARAQRLHESRGFGRSGREKRTTGSTP